MNRRERREERETKKRKKRIEGSTRRRGEGGGERIECRNLGDSTQVLRTEWTKSLRGGEKLPSRFEEIISHDDVSHGRRASPFFQSFCKVSREGGVRKEREKEEKRACTFAAHARTHTHTHAQRHHGATNYSGQNGTSSVIRECDFSPGGQRQRNLLIRVITTLRPTNREFRVCTDCPSSFTPSGLGNPEF